MNDKLKETFDLIKAEDVLKENTRDFLAYKTRGYTRAGAARPRSYRYTAVCACLILLLLGGHWLFFTPTSEISIEINPSIELSVNRFDRVISVNSLNVDGDELKAALDIKYRSYTDAIERILENEKISALLAGDNIMTITVTGRDMAQSAEILSGIELCTADRANTYCHYSSPDEVAAAHSEGLSCGKYEAYMQLKALDPGIRAEDVRDMTMREIYDLIDSLSSPADIPSATPTPVPTPVPTPTNTPNANTGHGHHGHGHDH